MAESVILFIEDEVDHFDAAKEHLEPEFKCARSSALQIETVAQEIEELKPVAIVLDLMLFSSSRTAKVAMAALRKSIALLERHSGGQSARIEDDAIEAPLMANDWLRALKEICPGVPVIVFSQLGATTDSLEELVAGAMAKRLDTKARLVNGKEFAEKLRQLIKG